MRLPDDFKGFLKSLNTNRVRYLVVGGYAVGFHGHPRATGDLDVWIEVSPENAERISRAVRDFGFDLPEVTAATFLKDDAIIRMGIKPLQIEIMTHISGVVFKECFKNRKLLVMDNINVNIIGLDDLIQNKKAAGRLQDSNDLEHLKKP